MTTWRERLTGTLWVSALCLVLGSGPVFATERHALLIGNSAYEHSAPLRNPSNDARSLAAALEQADFTVTLLLDGTHQQMEEGLRAFGRSLPEDSIALLFFAGHGMRVGGDSYLMPVDAKAESAETLKYEAVPLEMALALLDQGGKGAGLKIVMLDSCRNNPFGRNWAGSRSSAMNTGMTAPAQTPQGTVLCFATDPRATAADGTGEHSPYTSSLLKHLFTPGLELDAALRRVGADVQKMTDGKQNPWRNSSLNGDFAFVESKEEQVWMAGGKYEFPGEMTGKSPGEQRNFGGIDTVWCPPGKSKFGKDVDMGNGVSTSGFVTVEKGFWIAKYEVTQKQWESLIDTDVGYLASREVDVEGEVNAVGDNVAMYMVNWNDAQSWIGRMNYFLYLPPTWEWSLPSEAQWEYACRGGAEADRYSRDLREFGLRNAPELDVIAWYSGNSSVGYSGPGEDTSSWEEKQYPGGVAGVRRVGQKQPNAWGIHDMLGNVYEWCRDFRNDPWEAQFLPPGEGPPHGRPIRGGGWHTDPGTCRADFSPATRENVRSHYIGFRPIIQQVSE
ncbi:MAG: caspase family protein [Verrucomicrobiota bacterium]